jgi:pteridine reductase
MEGGGSIVAMCDIHAMGRPRKEYLAYSMSKAALAEMVQTLARELAPRVRVNGVAPGVVVFAESGADADPAMQKAYLSRVPLGRSGTPEDAARAVRWLAMEATYVTGEIVRLDGGRWLG